MVKSTHNSSAYCSGADSARSWHPMLPQLQWRRFVLLKQVVTEQEMKDVIEPVSAACLLCLAVIIYL